jgi:hypothetical protein
MWIVKTGNMLPLGRTPAIEDTHRYFRGLANFLLALRDEDVRRTEWVLEDGSVLVLFEDLGAWDEIQWLDYVRTCVHLDPDDPGIYALAARVAGDASLTAAWRELSAGTSAFSQGHVDAALARFDRAAALAPEEPVARWWQLRAHRLAEVESQPEPADGLAANVSFWAPLRFEIGALLARAGDTVGACEQFAAAARGDRLSLPDPEILALAAETLEQCPDVAEILDLRRQYRSRQHRTVCRRLGSAYLRLGLRHLAFEEYREEALADTRTKAALPRLRAAMEQMEAADRAWYRRRLELLEGELDSLRMAGSWRSP